MADSDQDRSDRDNEREGERDYDKAQKKAQGWEMDFRDGQYVAVNERTGQTYTGAAIPRDVIAKLGMGDFDPVAAARERIAKDKAKAERHAADRAARDKKKADNQAAAWARGGMTATPARPEWEQRPDGTIINNQTGVGYSRDRAPAAALAALGLAAATTSPITAPPAAAPSTGASPTPPAAGSDPFAAFKEGYRKALGREVTQDELSNPQSLAQLSGELLMLLPDDALGFLPISTLLTLPNEGLIRAARLNPNILTQVPAERFKTMPREYVENEVLPFLDGPTGNQQTAADVRGALGITTKTPGAGGSPITAPPAAQPGSVGPVQAPTGINPTGSASSLYSDWTGTTTGASQASARPAYQVRNPFTGNGGFTGAQGINAYIPPEVTGADEPATPEPPTPEPPTPTVGGGGQQPAAGNNVGLGPGRIWEAKPDGSLQAVDDRSWKAAPAGPSQSSIDNTVADNARADAALALSAARFAAATTPEEREAIRAEQEAIRKEEAEYRQQRDAINDDRYLDAAQRQLKLDQLEEWHKGEQLKLDQISAARQNLNTLIQGGASAATIRQAELVLEEQQRQFDTNTEMTWRQNPSSVFDRVWNLRGGGAPESASVFQAPPAASGVPAGVSASMRTAPATPAAGVQGGEFGPTPKPQTGYGEKGAYAGGSPPDPYRTSVPQQSGPGMIPEDLVRNLFNAPPPVSQQSYQAERKPLTYGEIQASGAEPTGIASMNRGENPFTAPGYQTSGGMPKVSAQGYNRLLPTERSVYDAELRATGNDPADVHEARRRLFAGSRGPGGFTAPRAIGAF